MFIFDFVIEKILGQLIDWIYSQIMDFLSEFFGMMNGMGAEIFEMSWIKAIVLFFDYLGWALFVVGIIVAAFECAIEYQSGRGSIKDTALNCIKGFFAVTLFTITPVELYKFCVSLQINLSSGLSHLQGEGEGVSALAGNALGLIPDLGLGAIFAIFILIMIGYSVIKIFFANLKRGGILVIQIAVGSLYMFSVVRGYTDGFVQWVKQVIGICLTALLQTLIMMAGLIMMTTNILFGAGLVLAAGEVPRIAGQFGMDTSTKSNLMSSIYAAQTAINITKSIGVVK